ncbi:unnamed protein product [Ilex paraguariensis]|uniref:EGF-like domain-containing protein n=1 Tax=Ilex paraguariensis TaxID=185542 RepID=A0ABC8RPA2_9AQUA
MVIHDFPVLQITSDSILVKIPAEYGCPVETLQHLFSPNYAPTSQNAIFLQNCTSPLTPCEIPTTTVQTHFELPDCVSKDNIISCYSEPNNQGLFIDYHNLTGVQCRSFLLATVVSLGNLNNSAVLVDQVVQLGWWLEGDCQYQYCSEDSSCITNVSPIDGRPEYRCQCLEGFIGDGYRAALGCRKGQNIVEQFYDLTQ